MSDTMLSLLVAAAGLSAVVGIWALSRRNARRREAAQAARRVEAVAEEAAHPGDDLTPGPGDGLMDVADALGVTTPPPPPPPVPSPAPGEWSVHTVEHRRVVPARPALPEGLEGLVNVGGQMVHPRCVRGRTDGRWERICPRCAPILVGSAASYPGGGGRG